MVIYNVITPLINIEGIYAKFEAYNPTGSIKDRMAEYIVDQAEKNDELNSEDIILEVTSGNTGIALARIGAIKGYKVIIVMPESMSIERRKMIESFGAKLILTPAKEDIEGAIKVYDKLKKELKVWLPKQFENKDNINAHYYGLGKEIIDQIDVKNIDVFVAGVGTGGTLLGVGKALKEINPKIKIVAIEPYESAVLSGEVQGLHGIQGIGEGFIPKLLADNLDFVDEVIKIKTKDAIKMSKDLAKKGYFVGISSGANFLGAKILKKKYDKVMTLFPDRGERYLN